MDEEIGPREVLAREQKKHSFGSIEKQLSGG
jgi:hypothetical protein